MGATLLRDADRAAREAGCDEVRLHINRVMTENLRYDERRGFVETHRAELDGYERVFLARQLPAGIG